MTALLFALAGTGSTALSSSEARTPVRDRSSLLEREVRSDIVIQASPQSVWRVLTDFAEYPEWNPFITSISGRLAVGEKLRVTIKSPTLPAITFEPIVQTLEPERGYSWLGHLYVPRLFDGRHAFEISPEPDGTVRFVQRETFTGLIVPLSGPILHDTESGFARMNQALKRRVENGPMLKR